MTTATVSCANTDALRRVLNPDVLAHAVRRAGFTPADQIDLKRVHFSSKRPVVLHLSVVRGDQSRPLLAEFVEDGAVEHARAETMRLGKSRRAQIDRAANSPLVADPETGLVFRPPGLDARLPGLKLLTDQRAAKTLMTRALGREPGRVKVTLVAHRLGKRAVLRLQDHAGRSVYARLGPVANDGPARLYQGHALIATSLAGHSDIGLPQPLMFDADLGAAVYARLPGKSLALNSAEGFRALHATSKAIEAFQSVVRNDLPAHGIKDELRILSDWVGRIVALRPGYRRIVQTCRELVANELHDMQPVQPGFCHRDLHEGQILIDGTGKAGILDLDTAAFGDPMLDVGNLMAHVFLHGCRTGQLVTPFEMALELGVGLDRAPADRQRCRAWRRAALLRLGCIYAMTSEPSRVIDALFAEAAA